MATRRSKALQLFVYMSRTSARGTSAFLRDGQHWRETRRTRVGPPAGQHRDVPPLFTGILSRMGEEAVETSWKVVLCWGEEGVHGSERQHGIASQGTEGQICGEIVGSERSDDGVCPAVSTRRDQEGNTRTRLESIPFTDIPRHGRGLSATREIDVAEPATDAPALFMTATDDLEDAVVPVSLTSLAGHMDPHAGRTGLRLAHADPRADEHAGDERAGELYAARARPDIGGPGLAHAEELCGKEC